MNFSADAYIYIYKTLYNEVDMGRWVKFRLKNVFKRFAYSYIYMCVCVRVCVCACVCLIVKLFTTYIYIYIYEMCQENNGISVTIYFNSKQETTSKVSSSK